MSPCDFEDFDWISARAQCEPFKVFERLRAQVKEDVAKRASLPTNGTHIAFSFEEGNDWITASKKILEEFEGKVPQTMEELLTLPGVARKTANVVLGSGFGIAAGVVVDTHVQRLSERLDLTKNTDPKKIEQDLMQIIPQERWILFSHQLIWHGRRVCNARKPKCVECNLERMCYSSDKTN